MTYLSTISGKSGTAPCIYIIRGHGLWKAESPRVKDSNEQCLSPIVRCHMLSRRALHLWFGVMERISLGLQENEMLLRNNGIFLLVIIISPVYLHQGPTKFGSTLPGTPSNSKFTESWSFQAGRRYGNWRGHDIPAQRQKLAIPQSWKGKAPALTTYPLVVSR